MPGEIAQGWKAVLAALSLGALGGGVEQWDKEKKRAMKSEQCGRRARAVRVVHGCSETRDAAGGSSRVEAACSRLQAAVRQAVDGGTSHIAALSLPASVVQTAGAGLFGGTQQHLVALSSCRPATAAIPSR